MNIDNKKIYLKKLLLDKINPFNKLFEIEIYQNKEFQFNYKYSYRYYNFEIQKKGDICEIKIYFNNNKKIVKKITVLEKKLYIY